MTQLHLIHKHHISLFRKCGHDGGFSAQELLERLQPETTANQVADKARCTVCGRKGNKEFIQIMLFATVVVIKSYWRIIE